MGSRTQYYKAYSSVIYETFLSKTQWINKAYSKNYVLKYVIVLSEIPNDIDIVPINVLGFCIES